MRHVCWLVGLSLLLASNTAEGQQCLRPSAEREWVALCADGNGIERLTRRVQPPPGAMPAARLIEHVALAIGGAVNFVDGLERIEQTVTVDSVSRNAAQWLVIAAVTARVRIEVDAAANLRVLSGIGNRLAPVVVRGTRDVAEAASASVGTTTTSMRELQRAPIIIAPDVLRLIRSLPGVNVRNDLSLDFNVRGGESSQNLILIDGYPIYNPFHLGGVLGTFIEPMTGVVQLNAGAFPARDNGRLAGLLTVRSRHDEPPGWHGTADVSLLATTAAVRKQSQDGRRYWGIGARRTYADAVAAGFGFNLPYYFQDAHGFTELQLGERHRWSVTGVYSRDRTTPYDGDPKVQLGWGNRLLGSTLRSVYAGSLGSDSVVTQHRASYSGFSGFVDSGDDMFVFESSLQDLRLATQATAYRGTLSHETGVELLRIGATYSGDAPEHWVRNLIVAGRLESEQMALGAWYELGVVRERNALSVGMRVDAVQHAGATFSPRLSLRRELWPGTLLLVSAGQHVQWIHSSVRQEQPVRPLDFWIGGPHVPKSRAQILTAGLARQHDNGRQLRLEGFYRRYANLADRNTMDDPERTGDEFQVLRGSSTGFDVLMKPSYAFPVQGWLSYTFTYSTRRDPNGTTFTPAHDRRHELNVVASRQMGAWNAASRFNLASGTPYTPVFAQFVPGAYDPGNNLWGSRPNRFLMDPYQYMTGTRNSARLPWAHRLDLGVSRTGRDGNARGIPYISLANAYGAFNPWIYYDRMSAQPKRESVASFRWLPTFGFRYAF